MLQYNKLPLTIFVLRREKSEEKNQSILIKVEKSLKDFLKNTTEGNVLCCVQAKCIYV